MCDAGELTICVLCRWSAARLSNAVLNKATQTLTLPWGGSRMVPLCGPTFCLFSRVLNVCNCC